VLSQEQIDALLAKVPPDVSRQIKFLLLTGLRPQEFRNLRWSDIVKEPNGLVRLKVDHPKAEMMMRCHQNRSVVLTPEAQAIVDEERSLHPKSTHIFLNDDGTPYTKDALTRRLNRWGNKAGIENLKPYDLRHWFGTAQSVATTNLSIIRQLMGHTKISTTDRYVHPVDSAHQEAMSRIANLVSAMGKN
jgi:integrase